MTRGPGIAVDGVGAANVAGSTHSSNFPTTAGAFQVTYGGTGITKDSGDGFVTKLNPAGSALVFSTYLGGNKSDAAFGISLDSGGNVIVAGATASANFPKLNPIQNQMNGVVDAFVTTLNSTGSALLFSTFLGGAQKDNALGVALDPAGNAYVPGFTGSTNFPTTPGAFQTSPGGGFVSKISFSSGIEPPPGGFGFSPTLVNEEQTLPVVTAGTPGRVLQQGAAMREDAESTAVVTSQSARRMLSRLAEPTATADEWVGLDLAELAW
jgi:hypothetical protein